MISESKAIARLVSLESAPALTWTGIRKIQDATVFMMNTLKAYHPISDVFKVYICTLSEVVHVNDEAERGILI